MISPDDFGDREDAERFIEHSEQIEDDLFNATGTHMTLVNGLRPVRDDR